MTDAIKLFNEEYAAAQAAQVPKADAMTLATVDANGRPSVRVVLLKAADDSGFTFYTNLGSRKAYDLSANRHAALCFYWQPLDKQVRIEGTVEPVSDQEADAYWATRPRGSQIGAWASRQSEPLANRAQLLVRVNEAVQKFANTEVPRPEFWSGYRLVPTMIEFWVNADDRLHDRVRYRREGDSWRSALLFP